MESMHAKFLELDVVKHVIAYDNIDYVMPDVVTFPLPNFDKASPSTTRGGLNRNENVAEHPVKNMVESLVDNVGDHPIMAGVTQPIELVE